MTDPTIAFREHLIKIGLNKDADFLQEGIQLLGQMLMELEVEEKTGAKKHERTPERKNHRNGYRTRTWETRVGEVELQIPKLRKGTYFPSLLEPRKPAEKALLAVVQQAYLKGVSTRKVDALVKELGLTGIDTRCAPEVKAKFRGSAKNWMTWSISFAIDRCKKVIPTCGWMPFMSK